MIAGIACIAPYRAAEPPAVSVSVSEIKDSRSTGKFFSELTIKLKLVGDLLGDAKFARIAITKAVDQTGRNLLPDPEDSSNSGFDSDFDKFDSRSSSSEEIEVKLRNPARRAATLTEVSGKVELIIPTGDPASVINVPLAADRKPEPVDSPALKALGVEITFLTKEQYDQLAKEAASKPAKDPSIKGSLEKSMGDALKKFFGGFSRMEQGDIAVKVVDPKLRVAGIAFKDASGKKLSPSSTSRSGRSENYTGIYSFSNPPDSGDSGVIYLATPGSTVEAPFDLKDVALP